MYTFDVLVWEDHIGSDGSTWDTARGARMYIGVSGQGDTEEEALADIVPR